MDCIFVILCLKTCSRKKKSCILRKKTTHLHLWLSSLLYCSQVSSQKTAVRWLGHTSNSTALAEILNPCWDPQLNPKNREVSADSLKPQWDIMAQNRSLQVCILLLKLVFRTVRQCNIQKGPLPCKTDWSEAAMKLPSYKNWSRTVEVRIPP